MCGQNTPTRGQQGSLSFTQGRISHTHTFRNLSLSFSPSQMLSLRLLKAPPPKKKTCPDWNSPKYPFSYQTHTVPRLSPIPLIPSTSQLIPLRRPGTLQGLRDSLRWWILAANLHHRCCSTFILNHVTKLSLIYISVPINTNRLNTFMSSCRISCACMCQCLCMSGTSGTFLSVYTHHTSVFMKCIYKCVLM